MADNIEYLISAVILGICGICSLYTGVLRRKNQKANNIFTVILILCSIFFAVSPYIVINDMSKGYGYMMFAFSYAAFTLLYIALYHLSFKKNTNNMQKLVFGFSVYIAFITLLSAIIIIVSFVFGLFMLIPKY